jgi:NCS2 family nucleobase:cation symporter-2
MTTTANGLIYGLDDHPPKVALAMLAAQHIVLMSSTLVLPAVMMSEIGAGDQQAAALLALTMMACGIGTILQSLRLPGFGSGYLCPNLAGPNFFPACMSAAWLGGIPLMRGMTIFAGLTELLFARWLPKIAFLFPKEVTGLVVFFVGMGLVPVGTSKFMAIAYHGDPLVPINVLVSAITLAVMAGINVISTGNLRLYGVLAGMLVGYALSLGFGLIPTAALSHIAQAQWVGLPLLTGDASFAFRWSLAPTFVIVSICGALKSFGNLTLAEKVNFPDREAPDIKTIKNGLTADATTVVISGLIGGIACDTSSSNVALSASSGATSRMIGYAAGALFFLLGFSPKLAAVLTNMPAPVAGAILVFVTSFMLMSGLQMIASVKLDARRTSAIGLALCAGLSVDILPQAYAGVAPWLRPIFADSLTLATIAAVLLTQVTRLGRLDVPPP